MFDDSQKHPEKVTLNLTLDQKRDLQNYVGQTGMSEAVLVRKLYLKAMNELKSKNPTLLLFEMMEG